MTRHPTAPQRLAAARLALALALEPAAGLCSAADLTVKLDGARPDGGPVRIAVQNDPARFPGPAFKGLEVPADATEGTLTGLPPGRYAIVAFQDMNRNGQLDRGRFNIPSEPYGFSQDARGNGGPPEFRDAAFDLSEVGARITVRLR